MTGYSLYRYRLLMGPILASSLLITGCAHQSQHLEHVAQNVQSQSDPWESINRRTLKFNSGFNKSITKPAINGYRAVAPRPIRMWAANFFRNLREPTTLANNILQGNIRASGTTLLRFFINSTLGVGGLFKVSDDFKITDRQEDFGQTLAVWGIPNGPYVVIPFLGPTNVRDGFGIGVESFLDPVTVGLDWGLNLSTLSGARGGADVLLVIDQYIDNLTELEKSSLDFYSALRSAYAQSRAAEVRNGAPSAAQTGNDPFADELEPTPAPAPEAPQPPSKDQPQSSEKVEAILTQPLNDQPAL